MKTFKELYEACCAACEKRTDIEEVKEPTGDLKKACWKGYTAVGMKMKNGRKVPNCVPANEEVEEIEERNKENAMRLLKSQLYEIELRKKMEITNAIEGNKKKIEWGSQIRNYVLHPYKLVKDLRTDYETSNAQAVLDGDLGEFLKAYLMEFGGNN